jgi:hypothetical protein
MKPKIDQTSFGSITIDGETFQHDVLIRLDGTVIKRKKKLSKAVYGTSHTLSLTEAEFIYQDGAKLLIFGSGQSGLSGLSPEAVTYFNTKSCQVNLLPTPQAVKAWNQVSKDMQGKIIALFHVTC